MSSGVETDVSATPILDRRAPLPPPARPGSGSRVAIGIGVCLAAAVILLSLQSAFVQTWIHGKTDQWFAGDGTIGRMILFASVAVVVVVATIAIHELGHVLGGLGAGFRFHTLRIGPLQLHRPFRVSWYRGSGAASGGWVIMAPDKKDRLRLRALMLVAGGPAASLLSGLIVLLLPFFHGFTADIFVYVSLAAGLGELLPFRTSVAVSDGIRIWMLLRNRERGERWLALMILGNELREGVLPESVSADYLASAVAVIDDSADTVAAHAIAYSAAFHQHKDAEAAERLEVCLRYSSRSTPVTRAALMSDAAVFQARRRKRPDLAAEWLAAMPAATGPPWFRSRVEAAILEAQGDRDGALTQLQAVEATILCLPSSAQREVALQLLRRWTSELGAR